LLDYQQFPLYSKMPESRGFFYLPFRKHIPTIGKKMMLLLDMFTVT